MNRRGNVLDVIPVLIIILSVAILLFVGLVITDNLSTTFLNASGVPAVASNISTSINSQASWTFDFIFVMLLFTLPLVSAMMAYFLNIPPFFYFASLGVVMIIVILANAFGDGYTSFTGSSATMTSVAARLPMTNYIMSHFVMYAFVSVIIIMFGVFMKPKRGI